MTRRSKKTLIERRPRMAISLGVGNSLTLDYYSSMGEPLNANLGARPARVWWAINNGVGGAQTPALTSSFAATAQPYFKGGVECVLEFCELTNHIGAGASFAVARDAAIAYCAQARAAGWKLAFHIPTPRAERATPGYEASFSAWQVGQLAVYDQACAYFLANPQHYDYLFNLAVVPELDDPYDTTYYQSDGCHFTAAGIAAKTAAVAAAILARGY